MECYTPATMLQHASRTAEAAEVAISMRPCHTKSRSSHETDLHSIGIFASILPYYNSKFGTMVPEPAALLHMLEILESEMISSRNAMSSKSRHLRRCLHTTVHTKLRKLCSADDADSPCELSLRHDETIHILP